MLIRERVELKRAAQRTERELARKAEEERIALVAARGTGPTRIPRGALAIAVAKKKKPGDNYELERQKALAEGKPPPAPMAPVLPTEVAAVARQRERLWLFLPEWQ